LVDGPGGFDLDVVVTAEQGLEPDALIVGEEIGAGVQHPTGAEQWVAGAAAVAVDVVLDAAPASVQCVAGQAGDVEGVIPLTV
jgi:hypothetical protein